MKYEKLVFPEYFDEFETLKPKEVKPFFDWYVSQSEERISYLEAYYEADTGKKEVFDFSPASLVEIWSWYLGKMVKVPKTAEQIEYEKSLEPDFAQDDVLDYEFSAETEALMLDISYYFAETIMRNHPQIHWSYFTKPKNRVSVKSPVLMGLRYEKDDLDPRLIVWVCSLRCAEEADENILYDTYSYWEENEF